MSKPKQAQTNDASIERDDMSGSYEVFCPDSTTGHDKPVVSFTKRDKFSDTKAGRAMDFIPGLQSGAALAASKVNVVPEQYATGESIQIDINNKNKDKRTSSYTIDYNPNSDAAVAQLVKLTVHDVNNHLTFQEKWEKPEQAS